MGELNEKRWAVMSERGFEASHLTYEAATKLVRRLVRKQIHGMSIITNEAALRLSNGDAVRETPAQSSNGESTTADGESTTAEVSGGAD